MGAADRRLFSLRFWQETLMWADGFARGVGVPVSFDVMCTANVSQFQECQPSATKEMVSTMQSSQVERFVSMGTYGKDSRLLLNQMDWFERELHGKWGLGGCPTCGGTESYDQLMLRFGTAHAYNVTEVDMFAFSASEAKPWEPYWPFLRAFLQCERGVQSGDCWP